MIVLKNGKKVFPEELETLVSRIECVSECMVFGLPDEKDKDDVKLSVKIVYDEEEVKKKYGNIDEKEIYNIMWNKIKELNTTFPRYKHIQKLILTDEEIETVNPGKLGQSVKMHLPIKCETGWMIRRKK